MNAKQIFILISLSILVGVIVGKIAAYLTLDPNATWVTEPAVYEETEHNMEG